MVTQVLLIAFASIVVSSAFMGLFRGLGKSVVRIITMLMAAVLTFMFAGPVTTAVAQNIKLDNQTLGEVILETLRGVEMIGEILEAAPLLQEAILVAPAFVLSVAVFPIVFFLLDFVSWVVYLIVKKPLCKLIFREGKKNENGSKPSAGVRLGKRFAGMGVGAVAGVLVFAMIVTPVLGLFSVLPDQNTMDETMDAMVGHEFLSAADAENVMTVYEISQSPLMKIYGMMGAEAAGRNYINSVSKVEADGQTTHLADEFDSLLVVIHTALEGGLVDALMAPEDKAALYEVFADEAFMNELMQDMFQSKLLRSAVPKVMSIAMETMAESMNVPADKHEVYHNMMDSVDFAVQNSDIDFAGIQNYEQIYGGSYGTDGVAAPRIFFAPEDTMSHAEYEEEMEKLQALIAEISAVLNQAISGDHPDFTDSIANYIVSEIMSRAAENGQSAVEGFDVQALLAEASAEGIDAEDAAQLLTQLTDPEQFETDMPTVETIVSSVSDSVKSAVADDEKAKETAETLANVVSNFAGAIAGAVDEEGQIDISKLDYEKIANAVSDLQNSTMKAVGSSVLDIVMAGNMGANSMVSDAFGALREGYENGEDIGGTIGTVGALLGLNAAMQEGQEGDMGDALAMLINNLDEFTIGLLPNILSDDTIQSLGIPAEYTQTTYGVIETLLTELAALKNSDNYQNEVGSILVLYNLATSGVEKIGADDIAALADNALASEAIFNTLKSVTVSNPFGIDIEDPSVRGELAAAIEDHYAKSDKTARSMELYHAVAALLGVQEDVTLG